MKNLFLTFSLLGLITPLLSQQGPGAPPVLDVQHYEISAEVVPDESFVKGEVQIRFVLLQDSVTLPFELNTRLSLLQVGSHGVKRVAEPADLVPARLGHALTQVACAQAGGRPAQHPDRSQQAAGHEDD